MKILASLPLARRMIWREKARFLFTTGGVGFSVVLILFLFEVYEGVKKGAANYVLHSPAEIWVCEDNSTNLIRSSSFLSAALEKEMKKMEGLENLTGILRLLGAVKVKGHTVTLLLFGFDPKSRLGQPSPLVRGTATIDNGQIIVDKAFAAKYSLSLGDTLEIQGNRFRIAGICAGTNAIVTQFVFINLKEAERLLKFQDVVSFYLLTLKKNVNQVEFIRSLKKTIPGISVFSKTEFIQNNIEEIKTGVLPIFWTIALFGGAVGVAVITLMLYGSILEKREDYALLKAVGASQKYLFLLVTRQSIFSSSLGFLFGLGLNGALAPLLVNLVPELSLVLTFASAAWVFVASVLIGTAGSLAPVRKLARIFPMEVFR